MQFPNLTYEYETLLYGLPAPPVPTPPTAVEAAAAAAAAAAPPQRLILTANLAGQLKGGMHSLYFQNAHVATIDLLSGL